MADQDIQERLKQYIAVNKNRCFALRDWLVLKNKDFGGMNALKCIYNAANGNFNTMNNMLDHLTSKKAVSGRAQAAYGEDYFKDVDIIRDENKELKLVGYKEDWDRPLPGQHNPRNPRIFRKNDNQTSKTYQNTEQRLYTLGGKVRDMFPDANNSFITLAMQGIRRYAATKHLNVMDVAQQLESGKLVMDANFRLNPRTVGESKTFVISEDVLPLLKEAFEMTEYKFLSNLKKFLHDLLTDPVGAQPPSIFADYDLNKGKLLRYLLRNGIIEKEERISDTDGDGNPQTAKMMVSYKVPKKNFDRKVNRLYIKLFERNLPHKEDSTITNPNDGVIEEDGEGGAVCGGAEAMGSTNCASSGQYSQPIFPIQRRTFVGEIEEDMTTASVGDYQYTVPFDGDKETLSRKNGVGGSVSVNTI